MQNISPVTCTELNSRTIRLNAELNNVSMPLRFTNSGPFKNEKESETLIAATEINIENICNALGYNRFTTEVVTLPKESQYQIILEINDDLISFNKWKNNDFEGCVSITCSREGNIQCSPLKNIFEGFQLAYLFKLT